MGSAARVTALIAVALLLVPPVAAEEALVARSISDVNGRIQADDAIWLSRPVWSVKPSGEGARVAIIDTGIDPSHPDLVRHRGTVLWRDFVHGRGEPYDDNGHGTHVAGIVAAHGSTQLDINRFYFPFGMRGIVPDVTLVVAKAMDEEGEGTDETVSEAIRWATDPDGNPRTDDGADVINLSIGIERPTRGGPVTARVESGTETKQAIRNATAQGSLVVVSAGNDGREDGVSQPGDMDEVVSVGATDGAGNVASFSNHGDGKPDLVAPGVIVSTYPMSLDGAHPFDEVRDGYTGMAGTSMAAPLVTATVALMVGANPSLLPHGPGDRSDAVQRVKDLLTSHARPLDSPGSGSGLLDTAAAFRAVDQGSSAIVWWFPVLVGALLVSVGAAVYIWHRRRRRSGW